MPAGISEVLIPGLSEQLRAYRQSAGLSQQALADVTGLSQSFLSRLERGRRIKISHATWEKLRHLVAKTVLVEPYKSFLGSPLEQLEIGIQALGAGQTDLGETILAALLENLKDDHLEVASRAGMWLAGSRRDRFMLSGLNGVLAAYARVDGIAIATGQKSTLLELAFVLGACDEMRGRSDSALETYRDLLDEVPNGRIRMETRLNSRIGALLTKTGDLESAHRHLQRSTRLATLLPDSGPYFYAFEKLTILDVRRHKYDEAYRNLLKARSEIGPLAFLRQVQSFTAEAFLLRSSGDPGAAIRTYGQALDLASEHDLKHQMDFVRESLREMRVQNHHERLG